MPPKIEWISAPETIALLEQVNGRPINRKYLSYLARHGRIARKPLDRRTYLYSKQDAEKVHLVRRPGAGRKPKDATLKMPALKRKAKEAA